MNYSIRRKLDMAERARDFCRTHPAPNEGYTAAVARLGELLVRAKALAEQEVSGRLTVTGAALSIQQLRQEIHDDLAMLAGLTRSAAGEEPDLGAGIARPSPNLSHQVFLTRARVALATGTAHRDLLVRYGMPETFLAELDSALDRFDQAVNEKHAGRAAHVGARADLIAVGAEIMRTAGQLDSLNRFRFRNDAESLAAWKSARNVAWPVQEKEGPVAGDAEEPAA